MTFESVKFQKQQSELRHWTGLAAVEMQCIFYFTITSISNEPMLNRHCLFYCFHFPLGLIMYINYFLQSTISMNLLGRQSAASWLLTRFFNSWRSWRYTWSGPHDDAAKDKWAIWGLIICSSWSWEYEWIS